MGAIDLGDDEDDDDESSIRGPPAKDTFPDSEQEADDIEDGVIAVPLVSPDRDPLYPATELSSSVKQQYSIGPISECEAAFGMVVEITLMLQQAWTMILEALSLATSLQELNGLPKTTDQLKERVRCPLPPLACRYRTVILDQSASLEPKQEKRWIVTGRIFNG